MVHTIFSDWNCFLPSVTIDGKDGHDWNLKKKNEPTFSSFNAMPAKMTQKNYG